jgi:hypothetical protein
MKRQVMGREVVVSITGGKLDFGPWEQIFYGEFDGQQRKRARQDYRRITPASVHGDLAQDPHRTGTLHPLQLPR